MSGRNSEYPPYEAISHRVWLVFFIDNQVRWHLCCSSCFEGVLCRWIINLAFYVSNSTASAKSWQLLSFESTCLVVSWPSQGSNNSKDRSAGGGKKSQQKDGCFISFKLYLDLSGKNDTTKVKTVPKVQVRVCFGHLWVVMSHGLMVKEQTERQIRWGSWQVEPISGRNILTKGRTCLSIRIGGWLVGTHNMKGILRFSASSMQFVWTGASPRKDHWGTSPETGDKGDLKRLSGF